MQVKTGWLPVLLILSAAMSSGLGLGEAGSDQGTPCMKDAMFVFDASGSMGTTDLTAKKPHIERVKEALRQVLPEIPAQRRMGLIVYGQGAYNQCDSIELKVRPQTNAAATIMAEIEKVTPAGRTPLTHAVELAADALDYRNNPSIVVLLTDGEETCGGRPCEMAKHLLETAVDLTIHVIGYRNALAAGLSATDGARCMAADTGGTYTTVSTVEQLVDAFRKTLTCPMFTQTQSGFSLAFGRPNGTEVTKDPAATIP